MWIKQKNEGGSHLLLVRVSRLSFLKTQQETEKRKISFSHSPKTCMFKWLSDDLILSAVVMVNACLSLHVGPTQAGDRLQPRCYTECRISGDGKWNEERNTEVLLKKTQSELFLKKKRSFDAGKSPSHIFYQGILTRVLFYSKRCLSLGDGIFVDDKNRID